MKILLAILSLPLLLSCNQAPTKEATAKTIILPAEPSKFQQTEDCYKDRNTVKIVGLTSAKVLKAGKLGILDCYETGDRYQACMIPEWATVGTEVRITGVAKEVFENERRAGTPFLISEINKP